MSSRTIKDGARSSVRAGGTKNEGKIGPDSSMSPSPNPSTPDYADKPYTDMDDGFTPPGPKAKYVRTVEAIQHKPRTESQEVARGSGAAVKGNTFTKVS